MVKLKLAIGKVFLVIVMLFLITICAAAYSKRDDILALYYPKKIHQNSDVKLSRCLAMPVPFEKKFTSLTDETVSNHKMQKSIIESLLEKSKTNEIVNAEYQESRTGRGSYQFTDFNNKLKKLKKPLGGIKNCSFRSPSYVEPGVYVVYENCSLGEIMGLILIRSVKKLEKDKWGWLYEYHCILLRGKIKNRMAYNLYCLDYHWQCYDSLNEIIRDF